MNHPLNNDMKRRIMNVKDITRKLLKSIPEDVKLRRVNNAKFITTGSSKKSSKSSINSLPESLRSVSKKQSGSICSDLTDKCTLSSAFDDDDAFEAYSHDQSEDDIESEGSTENEPLQDIEKPVLRTRYPQISPLLINELLKKKKTKPIEYNEVALEDVGAEEDESPKAPAKSEDHHQQEEQEQEKIEDQEINSQKEEPKKSENTEEDLLYYEESEESINSQGNTNREHDVDDVKSPQKLLTDSKISVKSENSKKTEFSAVTTVSIRSKSSKENSLSEKLDANSSRTTSCYTAGNSVYKSSSFLNEFDESDEEILQVQQLNRSKRFYKDSEYSVSTEISDIDFDEKEKKKKKSKKRSGRNKSRDYSLSNHSKVTKYHRVKVEYPNPKKRCVGRAVLSTKWPLQDTNASKTSTTAKSSQYKTARHSSQRRRGRHSSPD